MEGVLISRTARALYSRDSRFLNIKAKSEHEMKDSDVDAVEEEPLPGDGATHKMDDTDKINTSNDDIHETTAPLAEDPPANKEDDEQEIMRLDSSRTMDTSMESLKTTEQTQSEEMTDTKVQKFADFAGYQLGGKSEKPAFCLLDGFMQENDSGIQPFRVAIDRLPATLGRTHATSESNFFGLGKSVKALSRFQIRIDYRVPQGTLGQFTSADEFTYRAGKAEEISNPTNVELAETGIYVVTCLGKNPVKVNGLKVEQNETCVLPHGSTLKFSAFSVYFLLPKTPSTITMELPLKNKRKRKPQPSPAPSSPPPKKSKIPAFKSMQEELENMDTDELLSQLAMAHDKNIWDRRCQFMAGTISYRAVREAAQSAELQTAQATASANAPGISKQELVQWIQESEKFKVWADIMQQKLEPKSYQTNIAKAMQRAGYERSTNVSVGRHVRWYLPVDLCPRESATQGSNVTEKDTKENIKKEKGKDSDAGSATKDQEDDHVSSGEEELNEDGSKIEEQEEKED